jgi:hypothetical protein
MSIILRTLDANASIAKLTEAVQHHENTLFLRLISLAAGELGGQRANLATFRQGEITPPAKSAVLETIDGSLSQDAQQALLTAPGRECVCYGTLFVSGAQRNVAAFR